jgi:putative heme-binding domain-containing protein
LWEQPLVRDTILERLMRRYAQSGGQSNLRSCARLLELAPSRPAAEKLLAGFEAAYGGRPMTGLPAELLSALERAGGGSLVLRLRLKDPVAIQHALQQILDGSPAPQRRAELIRVLGEIQQPQSVPILLEAARRSPDVPVRVAAFGALQAYRDESIPNGVLAMYSDLGADERSAAEGLLTSRREWVMRLLQSLAGGAISPEQLAPTTLDKLLLYEDPQILGLRQQIWPNLDRSSASRLEADVERYAATIVEASGNPYSGKPLFLDRCGKCHRLFTDGGQLGPDLTPYQRDDLRAVLLHVINPSLQIREGYENTVVTLQDGRTLNGFVSDRDDRVFTLTTPDGQSLVLRREDVEDQRVVPTSIMPEGLLRALDVQQVRDLLAYLRSTQPLAE